MRKMKPSGKGSLLRSILGAFGIDARAQSAALPLTSRVETQPGPSERYFDYVSAMRGAEQAKATAIMEIRRRQFT